MKGSDKMTSIKDKPSLSEIENSEYVKGLLVTIKELKEEIEMLKRVAVR